MGNGNAQFVKKRGQNTRARQVKKMYSEHLSAIIKLYRYYHMGGSAKWKMQQQKRSQRIRGSRVISQQDAWIQSGSGSGDPNIGQSAPRICNRGADLPVHMPGSASPIGLGLTL